MNHNILACDTANGICSAAIYKNGKVIAEEINTETSQQAESLFGLIHSLFEQSNMSYNDLSALAVTTGPGSFTGIRVGVAAMQGVKLVHNKLDAVGVNSLKALSYRAKCEVPELLPIISVLDARRKQVYIQKFSNDLLPQTAATLINYSQITDYLDSSTCILAGNGAKLVIEHIVESENIIIAENSLLPTAGDIANIAAIELENNDYRGLEPFYIRPPDAKVSTKNKV